MLCCSVAYNTVANSANNGNSADRANPYNNDNLGVNQGISGRLPHRRHPITMSQNSDVIDANSANCANNSASTVLSVAIRQQ